MRTLIFPGLRELQSFPERGPLLMLSAALELAESALRLEHPCLDFGLPDPHDLPPTTELLAELLIARFGELQSLLARYDTAAAHAAGTPRDDLPF